MTTTAARPNVRWSLDFVHDQFACGRRFRILNIVDDLTRECLAAVPDTSISGVRVVRGLDAVIKRRAKPGMILSDHGTEFTSNGRLAYDRPSPGRKRTASNGIISRPESQRITPSLNHLTGAFVQNA